MTSEAIYRFSGKVHPERYSWTVPFHAMWPASAKDWSARAEVAVQASQVLVTCHVVGNPSLLDLKVHATEAARTMVAALGFTFAASVDVELSTCIDAGGNLHVFNTAFDLVREEGVDPNRASPQEEQDLLKLVAVGYLDNEVRHALSDLNEAIRAPYDTAFMAFRAVESIRQLYVEPGEDPEDRQVRKRSWARLREALDQDRIDLDWLTVAAKPRRHGAHAGISEVDRRRALKVARGVVLAQVRRMYAE